MKQVLIAEDHPMSRKMFQYMLESSGYEVLLAEDGQQAWDLLQHNSQVQLLMLDAVMPNMDGLELCRKIQQEHPRPVYILLVSGGFEQDEMLAAGASDYIIKPFDKKTLLARLQCGERMLAQQARLSRIYERLVSRLPQHLQQIQHLTSNVTRNLAQVASQYDSPALQAALHDLSQLQELNAKLFQLLGEGTTP